MGLSAHSTNKSEVDRGIRTYNIERAQHNNSAVVYEELISRRCRAQHKNI